MSRLTYWLRETGKAKRPSPGTTNGGHKKRKVVFGEELDFTPNKDVLDEPSIPTRSPLSQPALPTPSPAYNTMLHAQQQHQYVEAPKVISKAKEKGIFQLQLLDKVLVVCEKATLKKASRENREQQWAAKEPRPLEEGISSAIPPRLQKVIQSLLADLVEKVREDAFNEVEKDAQIEILDKSRKMLAC
ncbi:hypothetical protein R1flu_000939 [Riccia fluitans]|uniref:Uncharacterized protein n=1 Tax=Riccia fluitans TaxID=41844 RepID=A0ABD1Y5X5_9MARC